MRNSFPRKTALLLAFVSLSTGCSKKGPECQSLIGSINGVAASLAETQKTTGSNDAKPEQITAALLPFAKTASAAGEALNKGEFTVPEIKKLASETSAATLALASSASSMASLAEQMKGVDAAGKAIDEQKKAIDTNDAEIKKVCGANAALCVELLKVLVNFPPPPDKADDVKAIAAWSGKLNAWAADLLKVDIKDAGLKEHVVNFDKAWKSFAGAMSTLAGVTETAKKYDEATKQFNSQIDTANKATANANAFCTK
jgi:hypothetical protein